MEDNMDIKVTTIPILLDMLTGKQGIVERSLKNYHFLNTIERFDLCKKSANNLSFMQIKFNLMDEDACRQLAVLLKNYNAMLTVCNFTNIHDYDPDMKKLKLSIPLLLNGSPDCYIMYATNIYNANISNKLEDYFNEVDTDIISKNKHEVKDANIELPDDDFSDCLIIPCHNLKPDNSVTPKPFKSNILHRETLWTNYPFTPLATNANNNLTANFNVIY
jgi:hypothetical protein